MTNELHDRLDELEDVLHTLRAENAQMTERIAELEAPSARQAPSRPAGEADALDVAVSRRTMLRRVGVGAAAAGAGLLGGSVVRPGVAHATHAGSLTLGHDETANNAGTATTALTSGSSTASLRVKNTSGGDPALRLVPGSTVGPGSDGATGDLYVGSTGSLWHCTQGGNPATWAEVFVHGWSVGGDFPDLTDIYGALLVVGFDDVNLAPLLLSGGSNTTTGETYAPLHLVPGSVPPTLGDAGSLATATDPGTSLTDLYVFHEASADKDSTPAVVGRVFTSSFASFTDFPSGWPVEGMGTKSGNNNPAGGTNPLDGEYTVDLSTYLPEGTLGILFTLTAQDPTSKGFIAVWPSGAWPGNSNLNYEAGTNIATLAASAVAPDRSIRIKVRDGRPTHVIISLIAVILSGD